jgi:hypothetical protein
MHVLAVWMVLLGALMLDAAVPKPEASSSDPITAVCTFQDEKEVSVTYTPVAYNKDLPRDTVWAPGGSGMILFTQTNLIIGTSEIPIGAYSMYVIASKKDWTLVVNRNVTAGSPYDQKQDLLRVAMEAGKLSQPTEFKVSFAHMAPKLCNLRLDYGTTGTYLDIRQK